MIRPFLNFLVSTFCIVIISISCGRNEKANAISNIGYDTVVLETPFEMTGISVPDFNGCPTFSITDFGAVEGNKIKTTAAIDEAIKVANEAGCGIVKITRGEWFTGKIHFKSNVNLHLEEGATLSFSDKKEDYLPQVFTRFEGMECMNYSPLIYARGCENIAITGKGTLQGNGENWWNDAQKGKKVSLPLLYDMVMADVSPEERIMVTSDSTSYLRPSFVQFIDCKNVLLEGYTIMDGPMWTNHVIYCKNVTAKNLRVLTNGANNDGLVLDSSEDILVEGCYFSTGDDCVVIKSGINEDGWRVNKPTKNVVVRNCFTEHGHGGVVIGSEMSGGVENIVAHNCTFNNTERGLRIKSMRGRGGYVQNIYFYDIEMNNIKSEAIMVNMRYPSSSVQPRGNRLPKFANINIHDITSKHATYGIKMQGLSDNPIEGIFMENILCDSSTYGMGLDSCKNLQITNVEINSSEEGLFKFEANENIELENVIINGKIISE